jgi:8-oxo-dGTP pyrophosphatase MutT (NUDIX family)
MEIETLASQVVYENRWLRVREDRVRRANGHEGIYGVVERDDYALIIPVDDNGDLWVVEQFRYPVGRRFAEFPQGAWDGASEVDRETLARSELEEETGLVAGSLEHLGHLYGAYGYSDQGFDVWLATDLRKGEARPSAEEHGMEARRLPRAEWEAMMRRGEVKDSSSLSAWTLLTLHEG